MSFLDSFSPEWIDQQYRLWKESPEQLTAEWRAFFAGFELGEAALPAAPREECLAPSLALKQSSVDSLIYRYRDVGHLLACTDPLSPCMIDHPLLSLAAFDLDESDLDRTFHPKRFIKQSATLREIIQILRETYCHSVGVEFVHIQDPEEREWLKGRMEPVRNRPEFSLAEKLQILEQLLEAGLFEGFLHRKFIGQKRFSLEGGEVLIPLLHRVVRHAGASGIRYLVLGMAHRGRLTVLANIFGKPMENIFAEFRDNILHGVVGEGDVKYHKGFSTDVALPGGESIHLTLASNPSHLEAVDPVVEGKCRARQDRIGPEGGKRAMPVLIHGDAAFAGQGMVAETLNLSQLEGYRTGGTLHIVFNNQIGFTTLPADARSTRYATDVAKMLMVPVFHVHGEDPEAVLHAVTLALDYRQTFARDVVVEVICYRRYGHNEGDEPFFTQPLMYEKIRNRPAVYDIYADRLREEGVSPETVQELTDRITGRLEAAFSREPVAAEQELEGEWRGIQREYTPAKVETGVPAATLRELAKRMTAIPSHFTPHPKIAALLDKRWEAVAAGEGLDWGNAESLAFATLLAEGTSVRLSGQDSRRGTFNHRHTVLHDLTTGATLFPLDSAVAGGAIFRPYDSMLSENAVLGFEYGYSVESPETLTIWEAQFGDFANGAQVIIDQFIASGETKWNRLSGLVMLLPHGYEGQGAEHSSARIERYLQLCADNNIQVANPSTPAQLFHLLRRQMKQPFRKPLVVFTPKSLLRHPRCVSSLDDLERGWFREVIPDATRPEKATALLFCSGKIYYDLLEKKIDLGREDLALIRIEQLYPLRTELIREALVPFRSVERYAWVQEEPRNMGAWSFIQPRLSSVIGRPLAYIGRDEAAAPAVGSHRQHKVEQERLVAEALQ